MREQRHLFEVKIGRAKYIIAAQNFTDAIKQAEAFIDKEMREPGGAWTDFDLKSITKIHHAHDLLFTTTSELG